MTTKVRNELIPFSDGIIFRRVEQAVTAGGIVLPEGKDGKPLGKAIVERVGEKVTDIAPGDWIILFKDADYAKLDHIIQGETRYCCKRDDVICKVVEHEEAVVLGADGGEAKAAPEIIVAGDVVEIWGTAVVKDGKRGRVASLLQDGRSDVSVDGRLLRLGVEMLRRVEAA
jgi:co-chaperonin GroES (HSP10)